MWNIPFGMPGIPDQDGDLPLFSNQISGDPAHPSVLNHDVWLSG